MIHIRLIVLRVIVRVVLGNIPWIKHLLEESCRLLNTILRIMGLIQMLWNPINFGEVSIKLIKADSVIFGLIDVIKSCINFFFVDICA